MRGALVGLAMAALLAGCVSAHGKTVYDKPGVAADAKRADEAQCTRVALDNAGQRGAAYLAVDRDAVDRCMQARGYRVAAPK